MVFGSTDGFAASFDLASLDGLNGFSLIGIDSFDLSAFSVAAAGDVNGDGLGDLIVGGYGGDANGVVDAGESYVVFGSAGGFAATIDLAALDGSNGFVINGIDSRDFSGRSVSAAGDINGDGFADLIIGARAADPNGVNVAGEAYIVYGANFSGAVTHGGTANDDTLVGDAGANVMLGGRGNDTLTGAAGNDRLTGGRGDDILVGGDGDDIFVFGDGDGADTIDDFEAGAGSEDAIELFGVSGLGSFADVVGAASQVGDDTVIDFGGGDSITLIGVNASALDADDFLI